MNLTNYFEKYGFTLSDSCKKQLKEKFPNDCEKIWYLNGNALSYDGEGFKGKDTGLYYTNSMHVMYDGFVKREGYCWISWIGSDNSRRWMACGELNSRGYNTTPYGVFK